MNAAARGVTRGVALTGSGRRGGCRVNVFALGADRRAPRTVLLDFSVNYDGRALTGVRVLDREAS